MSEDEFYVTAMLSLKSAPGINIAFVAREVPLLFDASNRRFVLTAILRVHNRRNPNPSSDPRRVFLVAGDASSIMDEWRQSHRVREMRHYRPGSSVLSDFTSAEVNEWIRPGATIRRRDRDRLRLELEAGMAYFIVRKVERRFNAIKLGSEVVH